MFYICDGCIDDVQCCVSGVQKSESVIQGIPSFTDSFPIEVVTEDRGEFPVVHQTDLERGGGEFQK